MCISTLKYKNFPCATEICLDYEFTMYAIGKKSALVL